MSWTDSLNSITNAATEIYTSNRNASAADKNAKAANATANASVINSKNMITAAVVIALAIGAFVFFRRK